MGHFWVNWNLACLSWRPSYHCNSWLVCVQKNGRLLTFPWTDLPVHRTLFCSHTAGTWKCMFVCWKFSGVLGLMLTFDSFPSDLICLSKCISGKLFRCQCEGGDSLVSIVFIRRMSFLQDVVFFTVLSNTARYWVAQPSDLWGHRIRKRPCLPPLAFFKPCLIFLWHLMKPFFLHRSFFDLFWEPALRLCGSCS